MTDQEIIDKAVAAIQEFQAKVAKAAAQREAIAAHFSELVNEVMKQTGCEKITAERFIETILME